MTRLAVADRRWPWSVKARCHCGAVAVVEKEQRVSYADDVVSVRLRCGNEHARLVVVPKVEPIDLAFIDDAMAAP